MAGAALLFVSFGSAVLVTAYLTLASSLRNRDRAGLVETAGNLAADYAQGGLPSLRREALSLGTGTASAVAIRLYGRDGRLLYDSDPGSWGGAPAPRPGWAQVPLKGDADVREIFSRTLGGDDLLQVSQDDGQREDVLERFRWIVAALFLPTVLLGCGLGWLFARQALRPIRDLIAAVEAVLAGDSSARVPAPAGRDELATLGRLFNRMLERIESLIVAMKSSLDNVAHDLRTPLARMRAVAEEALGGTGKEPALREALADSLEEADRVSAMLAMLMDISEAESGTMKLRREPVDLRLLAEEAAELYRYVAEEKGVALDVAPGGAVRIAGDRLRLRQVLANLVDNAVKYTPARGRVDLQVTRIDADAAVTVRDTGDGIPPEELPRIWERLYRGRRAQAQRGLGLGLSLVQAVVRAHRGRVEASSAASGGSCFTVYLPASDARPG